jgi:tRNA (guanine6-N2)-methyltransferase
MINHVALEQVRNHPTQVVLTTNAGLEDTVKSELQQLCRQYNVTIPEITMKPFGFPAQLTVKSAEPLSYYADLLFRLRSIHHVQALIGHFYLDPEAPLNSVYEQVQQFAIPGFEAAETFRVTTNRTGHDHAFSSTEVQQYAGAGLLVQYTRTVSLKNFDFEIRCDVFDNLAVVGLQLTLTSLTNRHERVYLPRVSLQPHMAYALLAQARIKETDQHLLDPFCGAGTTLLEAASLYPWLSLTGTDYGEKATNGVFENLQHAGLLDRASTLQLDVYDLSQVYENGAFDVIVTNPPFGIKLNRQKAFQAFYGHFLEQAAYLLKPGGRLVLLATKWVMLKKQIKRQERFIINDIQKVKMGGVDTRIFSLTLQGSSQNPDTANTAHESL